MGLWDKESARNAGKRFWSEAIFVLKMLSAWQRYLQKIKIFAWALKGPFKMIVYPWLSSWLPCQSWPLLETKINTKQMFWNRPTFTLHARSAKELPKSGLHKPTKEARSKAWFCSLARKGMFPSAALSWKADCTSVAACGLLLSAPVTVASVGGSSATKHAYTCVDVWTLM